MNHTKQSPAPTVFHMFGGLGGGALGFHRAGFRSLGAIDNNPAACLDLERFTGETAHVADIAAMGPADLAGLCPESPDVIFSSPPCKGFSGCLPEKSAKAEKYQRLNNLSLHGIWLALEAWERPPRLILLENVPRIQSRGRVWLARIVALLHKYGYAVNTSVHDCGVLGGLAQRRKRFLLVARHMSQVSAYMRLPSQQRVRTIGEVLGELPVPAPGSTAGGAMHRLPRLSGLNWVRLALIPAGRDWRAIPAAVRLADRGGRPNGPCGVEKWDGHSHAVLGHTTSRDSWGSVADPRVGCKRREGGHGVRSWEGQSATVIGHPTIDNFPAQVADPRLTCSPRAGAYGIGDWDAPSQTVLSVHSHDNAQGSVSDPRLLKPSHWVDESDDPACVFGEPIDLESKKPVRMVIAAADRSWHRPMTTLELAALQGFPTELEGEPLVLGGKSHAAWRERIGNAVPPPAAYAMAKSCAATLAAAAADEWTLDSNPIWVREQLRRRDVTLHRSFGALPEQPVYQFTVDFVDIGEGS